MSTQPSLPSQAKSHLTSVAKSIAQSALPETYAQWRARRARAYIEQHERETGRSRLMRQMVHRHGNTVLRGPMQGVQIIPHLWHRHLTPVLIGSYENRCHAALEYAQGQRYDVIVDVGTADGVYATGLALRHLSARVIAYDTDAWSRRILHLMASANRAKNITVRGWCDPATLQADLSSAHRAFVLCDTEGYEDVLMDPAAVPALQKTDVLIEAHPHRVPDIVGILGSRFAPTHHVEHIRGYDRDPGRYPELSDLPPEQQALAVDEGRIGPGDWIWARSKG